MVRRIARHSSFRRRGNTLVLVGVTLPVLIGFAALTIDVGYMYGVRTDLQNAVDAAALAGASGLSIGSDEVHSRSHSFATKNVAYGLSAKPDSTRIVLGSWDSDVGSFTPWVDEKAPEFDAVRVSASTRISFFFAPLFGRNDTVVSASATATFGKADEFDVMLVQDVSWSFTDALDMAKAADEALIDCLKGHTNNQSKIGLVTFTGTSQLVAPFESIETGFEALLDGIVNLEPCCWAGRWGRGDCGDRPLCNTYTNIAAGLSTAVSEFANSPNDRGISRAIVLLSDGQPKAPPGSGRTDADLRELAVKMADAAHDRGVSVYTVYFSGSSDTPRADSAFLETLIRGDGTYQETPDADDLSTLLWNVCASLPLMLVE